jgi:putative endonuclease
VYDLCCHCGLDPQSLIKTEEMRKEGYIYFLSNQHNNVLYVGVTNNLIRRIAEHKAKINKGFTYKYNCDKLVYFEKFTSIVDAILKEKQLKNWKREWKNELINGKNPAWRDLSEEIGVDQEWIESVKEHYKEIAGQARNDSVMGQGPPLSRNL